MQFSYKVKKEYITKKQNLYEKQLNLLNQFINSKSNPEWLIIKNLPVLPADLRPILKLDNQILMHEINYNYLNIINTNNKIVNLRKLLIPEQFINKEKIRLQKFVNTLFDKNNEKLSNLSFLAKLSKN